MTRADIKHRQAICRRENEPYTARMEPVGRERWDNQYTRADPKLIAVYRSNRFLAQVFEEKGGMRRITVNRTMIDDNDQWLQGIGWDELQSIKDQLGYNGRVAIEFYPPTHKIVNVANMRHLWVYPAGQGFDFMWGSEDDA